MYGPGRGHSAPGIENDGSLPWVATYFPERRCICLPVTQMKLTCYAVWEPLRVSTELHDSTWTGFLPSEPQIIRDATYWQIARSFMSMLPHYTCVAWGCIYTCNNANITDIEQWSRALPGWYAICFRILETPIINNCGRLVLIISTCKKLFRNS